MPDDPKLTVVHDADAPKLVDELDAIRESFFPEGGDRDEGIAALAEAERRATARLNAARLQKGGELRARLRKAKKSREFATLDAWNERYGEDPRRTATNWYVAELLWILHEHGPPGAVPQVEPLLREGDLEEILEELEEAVQEHAVIELSLAQAKAILFGADRDKRDDLAAHFAGRLEQALRTLGARSD